MMRTHLLHRFHTAGSTAGSVTPAMVYRGETWRKTDRTAKQVTGPIRPRHFREQRIPVYELAARANAGCEALEETPVMTVSWGLDTGRRDMVTGSCYGIG
jgi:hypothetical protein